MNDTIGCILLSIATVTVSFGIAYLSEWLGDMRDRRRKRWGLD